jgi:D-3-phosphoglycerate dehydrogenase
MQYRVLVTEKVSGEGLDFLREKGYFVKIGRGTDKSMLMEDLRDCDALLVRVAVIDREIFENSPKLKVVAKHGVGVDNIDIEAAKKHGCRVVYTPTANSVSVAEQAAALMIACAKKLSYKAREYARGNYGVKDTHLGSELYGKTLGLIGAGRIAREVARIARNGFRMRVIAYDPFLPAGSLSDLLDLVDRETVLKESDYISIHMPANKDTIKSFGEKEFSLMKPAACLINTARGKIVDEEALIKALQTGSIGGAGLDVTDPEPALGENPLFAMDHVIMTPHTAGGTVEAMIRMAMDAAKGIDDVLSGREPAFAVV